MHVYTMDEAFRRVDLIDQYESFIWTERYSAVGDFELVINSDPDMRRAFYNNVYISIDESQRLMRIDMVEDSVDDEGRRMLLVKGKSLEQRLQERLATPPGSALSYPYIWQFGRTPSVAIRTMYKDVAYNNHRDPRENFTDTQLIETVEPGRIPELTNKIDVQIDYMTLYDAIREVAVPYDIGFAILADNLDGPGRPLSFRVYNGYNRTVRQSQNAPVVFAPELDNLDNMRTLKSIADWRNVAYVSSKNFRQVEAYSDGVDPSSSGTERRVLFLKLDDLPDDLSPEDEQARMVQRGKEELAKRQRVEIFDGEITQYSQYKYGQDYGLGDIVELQDGEGNSNEMMVTEQIFVSDEEGERSYPTLQLYRYINAGSWFGWNQTIQWADLGPEEWVDMP